MKFLIIHIGKTNDKGLASFISEFEKRIGRFASIEIRSIDTVKGKRSPNEVVGKECESIMRALDQNDHLILMDEKGKSFTSREFSGFLKEHFLHSSKRIVLVIGGAYGFNEEIKKRSKQMIRLSSMTFNHELALAVLTEQLYRALTILQGHPYHND